MTLTKGDLCVVRNEAEHKHYPYYGLIPYKPTTNKQAIYLLYIGGLL